MSNVGVANLKSGDYHFFFCFFCSLLTTHLWYLVYGGTCSMFDHHKIFAISRV